ncbi:adenylate/guanylate cyclase domain-containing protein [Bradyrhizobium sp. AUGA SZCCT0222]|uniref:adenylate/guanylate cyclase domain-containing protein n=1 Tax=Bradyrhizobium sp. AUGA SZCCT0222 TaxID=2807668 RepID=UPI001BABADAE|nr:adenylate/guanylate cyclase domain-containing protein [Bradyrhizobium sp. AUGA SZCCT0222]MBR1270913.1 adenylate/guanylate cyclase domain-containing protein [Bradyrhizobium sp. AUGA SZCCT0222]
MAGEQVVRRLAAIVAADVVGYSRLIGADETGTLARLAALRRDIVDHAITRHAGRLFKETGDGFLVEFTSAVQAVTCSMEIQKQVEAKAGEDQPLRLRIGIHLGDVVVQGEDLMGDGVNIAARIEGIADPGGVALSRAVYEQVRDRLSTSFADRGEIELKNISRPVHIFAVGGESPSPPPALALPDKPSIVVLPFQNMSGDPEQDYFADGMVEEITTVLSRVRWLFVIARSSAFTYKGQARDLRQVGRDLGVRYLLEGSVRKSGRRVRVTAQLIDAETGAHLWADRFDGELEEIFDMHDRVATEVVSAIEPNLRHAEIERSLRKPTTSLDAYDFYMRASAAFREPSGRNLRAALDLTQQAISRDPHFARALALRAACIMHSVDSFGPDAIPEALRLAHAALATTGDDSEATSFAAMTIALLGGSIETALTGSERALMLNPNGFSAIMHGGWVHSAAGLPNEAINMFTRALRLSPRDPFRGYCELGLAIGYRDAGHPENALAWARRAILTLPQLAGGYRAAAVALVDLGRVDEARDMIRQLLQTQPHARIDPDFVRRQNRNESTTESWIRTLRQAGLPD